MVDRGMRSHKAGHPFQPNCIQKNFFVKGALLFLLAEVLFPSKGFRWIPWRVSSAFPMERARRTWLAALGGEALPKEQRGFAGQVSLDKSLTPFYKYFAFFREIVYNLIRV